jgi:hypothetical protein
MKNTLKKIRVLFCLIVATFMLVSSAFLLSPFKQPVYAANEDPCTTITDANREYCASRKNPNNNLVIDTIKNVSIVAAWIGGFLAVFWIIVMGIKYATAGGNADKATSARNGIIYAAVGLMIIGLAETIVLSVISLLK